MGKQAGLAPGTRSGLWAHMATAIDALQPEFVVIENVHGLLSAPAVRNFPEGAPDDRCNPDNATPADDATATLREVEPDPWGLGDEPARPLRAFGAVAGDLADLRRDARWIGLPASAIGAPHQRFRIFVLADRAVPNPAGLGLLPWRGEPGTVRARRGTIALSHQIIDLALHGPAGSPRQSAESETLWSLIEDIFAAGDATPQLSPDGNTSPDGPPPHQRC